MIFLYKLLKTNIFIKKYNTHNKKTVDMIIK